ncbi:MAG: hypothetical protein V4594_20165 [Bacteroidota bacterium]
MGFNVVQRSTNEKFNVINREAGIISELLTSGLEAIRKIYKSQAYYYQSFYAISMGFERLMKLIIHIELPTTNPYKLGHKLEDLSNALNITFPNNSIEHEILVFLTDFAKGDRYTIVDFLYNGDSDRLAKEPIVYFYKAILTRILNAHPPKKPVIFPNLDDCGYVLSIKEDLTEIQSLNDWMIHNQTIEHASKYSAMYMARILRPFISRLESHGGNPNPHFSELFRYLPSDDNYYLTRKTYRL